jgi:hypothetical protein
MSRNITAFWHKVSFDWFMKEKLPQFLATRIPLAGYHFESTGAYTCRVKVILASTKGDVEVIYDDVPQPDADGIFQLDGGRRAVVPIASHEELDVAEIKCVGEQLYDYFKARLGGAPGGLPWDTSLVRAWFPLDKWIREFLRNEPTAQTLQENNWLDRQAHLRRLRVAWRNQVLHPSYFGRVCPYETPEGPNVGKILSIALGAEIRDGKLAVIDNRPQAMLGLSASLVPFIEHNDLNRQLMGANMMRQFYTPPDPELALVQTENTYDIPGFWCGRNILTAYVPWGVDTFEDAIIISESCAQRFNYPYPVEPGDKFANRHGTKGCISRILPDDEMPHLADGTPVELIYNTFGVQTRMNIGQLREAVMSRIAKAEGKPIIVPPFGAPRIDEIRARLKSAGLPEDGMEYLTLGKNGKRLARPSLVGWVYWGCLYHIAREKITMATDKPGQRLGGQEYQVLRDIGAFDNLRERFNTCSANHPDAKTLANRISAGTVEQAGAPTPMFANLTKRLALAGIRAQFDGEKVRFSFARPEGKVLKLARPIPHPWLFQPMLSEVGIPEGADLGAIESAPKEHDGSWWVDEGITSDANLHAAYRAVVEVNSRAERMFASNTPESLTLQTLNQLGTRVREYFDALVAPEHLRFEGRSVFSGRAVIEPDIDLRHDQVGIPEEMAWTLFGAFVTREIGNAEEVSKRTQRASQALDELMARSWVIVYRAPAMMLTSFIACHPVRRLDNSIHLDPIVCAPMNADFDGDQVALFLPITEAAQREAGEKLSLAAHLERDPGLLESLRPALDPMWGLASLSLTPEGRAEISRLASVDVEAPDGFITRATLGQALRTVLKRDGAVKTLEAIERLMKRGFEVAKESGVSISPFIGESLKRQPPPPDDNEEAWDAYTETMIEKLAARKDFNDNDLGPQLLGIKSGARGRLDSLSQIVVRWNSLHFGLPTPPKVRHGYRDGLTPNELRAVAHRHWEGLVRVLRQMEQFESGTSGIGGGFTALGRAMRAKRPGIVFACAAEAGEVDGLVDVDSRLFVGLPVTVGK